MKCINTTTPEYLALQELTGLATFELNTLIEDYYDKHGTLPTVDKCLTIDFDTSQHLIKEYNLRKQGNHYTTDQEINQVEVNTKYRDLEVEVKEPYVGTHPIITIKQRALPNRDLVSDETIPNYPTVNQLTQEINPDYQVDGKFIYLYKGSYYVTDQRISDYKALKSATQYSTYAEASNAQVSNAKVLNGRTMNLLQQNQDKLDFGLELEVDSNYDLPPVITLYQSFSYPKFITDPNIQADFEVKNGIIRINPRVFNEFQGLERALLRAQGCNQQQLSDILATLTDPIFYETINKGGGKFAVRKRMSSRDIESNQLANTIIPTKTSIEPILDRLEELYGIRFNRVTNEQIRNSGLNKYVPDATITNAFILNGEIYINLDNANADAPIHEMGHLLLGTLRQTNPEIYVQLVNSVEQYPGYEYELKKYRFRSRMDANEEIFVDLFARHYTQQLNLDVDPNLMSEAEYQIARNIDSAIFPNTSTTKTGLNNLMDKSLTQIMSIFGTALNKDTLAKVFTKDLGSISRQLGNMKESLLRSQSLKEYCNG